MTRSELIQQLARKHPSLSPRDIEMAVNLILEEIAGTLEAKGRVEVRGFGSFCLLHRPPRKGRNPKTGQIVDVPAKDVPHFRAGKELRMRVNREKQESAGHVVRAHPVSPRKENSPSAVLG